MISRDCINKTGKFDEIFERGYSEETDYQFNAMAKGFKAKVLIDTYVFHEARISFGESEQQLDIRKKHLEIFFERWGKEYYALLEKYNQNDPIKYIKENIKYNKKGTYIKHIINTKINQEEIDILNNLIISNYNINIITKRSKKWMDFNTLFIPSRKRD